MSNDAAHSDRIQEISDWLVDQGLSEGGYEDLLTGFCERLLDAGIPLQRTMLAMRTLHPTIDAHSLIWRAGQDLRTEDFTTGRGPTEDFAQSPMSYLLSHPDIWELRRPLTGSDAVFDFPVLQALSQEGMTDYLIQKVAFPVASLQGHQTGMLISWTTDAEGGFSDRDERAIRRLVPRLALAMSNRLLREITINVLDTYVGKDAGRRILAGEIRRGSLQETEAVILFMDLSGFTALSDRTDGAYMAALLNDYFERIVPPIVDRGGEILKYMGDGVLAIFNLEDLAEGTVCQTGLDAAIDAIRNVQTWNETRRAGGDPVMDLDIAVHLGRVQYGNVGAGNRLDFTVIGAAVNEASRLESLSGQNGWRLVISEKFAGAASHCTGRLVSLGRHPLRGVREDQELYTVQL